MKDSWSQGDMDKLEREIRALLPKAEIERWRDFEFAMDVTLNGKHCVACEVQSDKNPPIFRTAEEVAKLLGDG